MDTYCKGKWEHAEGKGARVKNKKGHSSEVKRGNGALLLSNRGTCQRKRGTSYKIKGALFLCKKGHFWGI